MGQKLSDLKSILANMEDKKVNDVKIPLGNDIYRSDEATGSDTNGNEPAASDHFEGIYNTTDREENGNIVEGAHAVQSTSYCKKVEKKSMKKSQKKNLSGGMQWVLRFNCARVKNGASSSGGSSEGETSERSIGIQSCVCSRYHRIEEHPLSGGNIVLEASDRRDRVYGSSDSDEDGAEFFDIIKFSKIRVDDDLLEDCDERARLERAREIAEGVEPPPGFRPGQHVQLVNMSFDLTAFIQARSFPQLDIYPPSAHTQVDYIHCLVPDLLQITSCSFYWGKMDRYEAERLLDGKPEGTFLLRDSAQEEYLFSVSFRKYGRSLHARVEQWRHMFSFDSRDPGVFSSSTVCGLIEHYKDPTCCMFFEPMLNIPLHRNFPFPLQHLSRAVICSRISYDGISQLKLPKILKVYLKEYHYKQRVKVRSFEPEQ